LKERIFGEFLKGLREELGSSITDIAMVSGLSRPYLSLVESGSRNPTPKTLRKLAGALPNTDLATLFEVAGYIELAENERIRSVYEDFGENYNLAQLQKSTKALEEIIDIHLFLEQKSNLFKTQNFQPYYKSHPLTEQDRKRILTMLEVLFPEYQNEEE